MMMQELLHPASASVFAAAPAAAPASVFSLASAEDSLDPAALETLDTSAISWSPSNSASPPPPLPHATPTTAPISRSARAVPAPPPPPSPRTDARSEVSADQPAAKGIVKFTNCLLSLPDRLVAADLWVDASTGRILDPQRAFFSDAAQPTEVRDLGGRILAPGFIDVQLNGAFGFDFSVPRDGGGDGMKADGHGDGGEYARGLEEVNRRLVKTGVTSYLPTLTSQRREVYHKVLPHLRAPDTRDPLAGSESLGAHCEGPFLNATRKGIHNAGVLLTPAAGIASLEACYGARNLEPRTIRAVTLAPELDPSPQLTTIRALVSRGIVHAAGHSAATYEQMCAAVRAGTSMVTHMFNAMNQPHHRDPGIFGILGAEHAEADGGAGGKGAKGGAAEDVEEEGEEGIRRPFFGIIADAVHVHPSYVRVAYSAHPDGAILVTDAMAMLGLPDGRYEWTNGDIIVKRGSILTLGDSERIAGSAVTLITCISNLLRWTDASIASAIRAATATPARMLGLAGTKGSLQPGADADLVVLSQNRGRLVVDEVWKFGVQVFDRAVEEERKAEGAAGGGDADLGAAGRRGRGPRL